MKSPSRIFHLSTLLLISSKFLKRKNSVELAFQFHPSTHSNLGFTSITLLSLLLTRSLITTKPKASSEPHFLWSLNRADVTKTYGIPEAHSLVIDGSFLVQPLSFPVSHDFPKQFIYASDYSNLHLNCNFIPECQTWKSHYHWAFPPGSEKQSGLEPTTLTSPTMTTTQGIIITTLSDTQTEDPEEESVTSTSSLFSTFNGLPILCQFRMLLKIYLLLYIFLTMALIHYISSYYLAIVISSLTWSPSFTFFHQSGLYTAARIIFLKYTSNSSLKNLLGLSTAKLLAWHYMVHK